MDQEDETADQSITFSTTAWMVTDMEHWLFGWFRLESGRAWMLIAEGSLVLASSQK